MIRMLSIFAFLIGCLLFDPSPMMAQEKWVMPDGNEVPLPAGIDPAQKAQMIEQLKAAGAKPAGGESPKPEGGKPDAAKGKDGKGKDGKPAKPDEKEGPAENIKRTGEPPAEPDKEELKVEPDDDGLLDFQFRNQPWPSVLRWYADVSDLSFDWQELPGDYINLATQRPHSLEETGDMINRALLMRGFTMLQDGETLTVAKVADLNPSLVPRVTPENLNDLPPHKFVRTSFPLTFLLAEEVHQEFASMISKNGKLTPLQSTNRLEGMDAAANLRDIHEILEMEQSAIAMQDLAKEFPLTFARATSVKEQLQQFLGIQSNSGGMGAGMSSSSASRMMQQQMQQMQQQMQRQMQQAQRGGAQPAGGASRKPRSEQVYLVANERSNSIIVHAPPNKMAIIAAFIARVDVKNENAADYQRLNTRMKVFRLASLSPTELVASLTAMDVLEPATRLQVDDDNNAIIAYASVADQFMIQQVIDRLDGSERNFEVIQLRRLKAEEVAGSIKLLMGTEEEDDSKSSRNRYYYDPWSYRSNQNQKKSSDKMRIGANVQDNQLLLWVNEIELEEINKLLEKLGEIPTKGDRKRTTRMIDASRQPETYEYLLRLKEQWDRVSPNPLLIPDELEFKPPEEPKDEPAPETSDKPSATETEDEEPSSTGSNSTDNITGAIHSSPTQESFAHLTSAPFQTDPSTTPEKQNNSNGRRIEEGSNLEKAQQQPPVRIFLDPSGNLVIQSDDTDALDRLERIMQNNKPPQKSYDVFKVKYARASWVTLNLEEYFEKNSDSDSDFPFFFFGYGGEQNDDKDSQLGDRAELKFIWDNDTNTIVVQNANDIDRQTIKQLIELWDVPEEEDTSRIRYTKLIPVRYSRAENIVNTIKEAYRDLLSANDKTFQGGEDGDDEESKRGGGGGSVQGDGFNFSGLKGKLSLGPDSLTNSILISVEGKDLLEIIEDIIKQLDEAAMDQGQVEVLTLSGGMSGSSLKKALSAILGRGGNANAKQQNAGQQQAQQQAEAAAAQQAQAEAAQRSGGGGSRGRGRR